MDTSDRARPGWHDRAVANAADAWLSEPRDVLAYQRLVEAILRRRAWLHPTLGFAAANPPGDLVDAGPELLDALGADRPPVPLAEALTDTKLGPVVSDGPRTDD